MSVSLILTSVGLKRIQRLLFQPVTCQIKSGEILEVVGPNGIGKTSLLKILAGWIKPTQGTVDYSFAASWLYLSLRSGFDDRSTVQENLHYLWILEGNKTSFPEFCLTVFRIEKFRNRLFSQLSAGQRQRVHLTRLLLMARNIWLLDEPFTSLDKEGCQTLRDLCHRHQDQGGLIVLASPHSLGLGSQTIYLQPSDVSESMPETDWTFL